MKKTLDDYLRIPYRIYIVPEECTDGSRCYLARIPELPGCESHGDTPEEARANLEEAKELFLTSMLDDGVEPPKPTLETATIGASALTAVWRVDDVVESVDQTNEWTAPSATFSPV